MRGPVGHNDLFIIRDRMGRVSGTERREEIAKSRIKGKPGWKYERVFDVFTQAALNALGETLQEYDL